MVPFPRIWGLSGKCRFECHLGNVGQDQCHVAYDAVEGRGQRFWKWLNRLSNPIMALVALGALIMVIVALNDTRDALERTQRAWLAPGGIKIKTPFTANTYQEVWLSFGNTGNEPAMKIRLDYYPVALPAGKIRNAAAIRAAVSKMADGVKCAMKQPDPEGSVSYPSKPGAYSYRVGISASVVNQIIDKKNFLLIAGCFTYESFGKVRHSAFCRFFDFNVKKPDDTSVEKPDITSMDWLSSVCPVREYAD